jgi:hypothetical protein
LVAAETGCRITSQNRLPKNSGNRVMVAHFGGPSRDFKRQMRIEPRIARSTRMRKNEMEEQVGLAVPREPLLTLGCRI